MKIEVLVSTMNCNNKENLIKKMNIKKCVIINQITKNNQKKINDLDNESRIISFKERGLSKSRNKAIQYSDADICVIADDDMIYKDDYEKTIRNAYLKYADADIIAFSVSKFGTDNIKNKKIKEGKIGYLKSIKVQSVQITFKKDSIMEAGIQFDEKFGAGTETYMGEENIFLWDCLKKKLKIYSVPIDIAYLEIGNSSWFEGYNEKYFKVKGKCFYRMSKKIYMFLILQFAIRKRKIYKNDMSVLEVIINMFKGVSEYKRSLK